jgi:hypothetical protein
MKESALLVGVGLLAVTTAAGCGGQDIAETETPTETDTQAQAPDAAEGGALDLMADGEDFMRQGFVTKDGRQGDFEHVLEQPPPSDQYQTL